MARATSLVCFRTELFGTFPVASALDLLRCESTLEIVAQTKASFPASSLFISSKRGCGLGLTFATTTFTPPNCAAAGPRSCRSQALSARLR
eukprot:scaffold1387_cov260-Pinguiococcus_pyrenoidosus.AAC.13